MGVGAVTLELDSGSGHRRTKCNLLRHEATKCRLTGALQIVGDRLRLKQTKCTVTTLDGEHHFLLEDSTGELLDSELFGSLALCSLGIQVVRLPSARIALYAFSRKSLSYTLYEPSHVRRGLLKQAMALEKPLFEQKRTNGTHMRGNQANGTAKQVQPNRGDE